MLEAANVLNWKYGSSIGSDLYLPDLYILFNDDTSPPTPVISFCKTFTKSHWSTKLVLIALPNLKSVFNPVDLFVLSGAFLDAFFKFLVGKSVFFANLKLRIALPT